MYVEKNGEQYAIHLDEQKIRFNSDSKIIDVLSQLPDDEAIFEFGKIMGGKTYSVVVFDSELDAWAEAYNQQVVPQKESFDYEEGLEQYICQQTGHKKVVPISETVWADS